MNRGSLVEHSPDTKKLLMEEEEDPLEKKKSRFKQA